MTNEELFAKVKDVIVEKLDVEAEKVTLEASFTDDLDADSLELVDLTMEFEDKLGVSIEDSELEKIKTVNDVVVILSKKL